MTQVEELQHLISTRRRRLQALKEKEAVYGYSADPSILLEIEDIEAEITNLQAELEQLESAAAASPAQPQQALPPAPQASSTTPETLVLQEALPHSSLALFIGADLPQTITGLLARSDLTRQLARRHGLDESLSLAEVAQRVSQAGNRWEFTNFLRTALDTTGKAPQPFHQRLAALVKAHQIETIITTAYDNLLELAFQQAGLGFNRVVRGSDVNFIDPGRPTLIKLYGDLQQPDTLVVTDQDHSALLRDREREVIIDELRGAFRRTTLLFLGYDLADPDFRFLFDQIAESRFARQAYAVWPGLPKDDVRMWRDRGIVILEADPFQLVTTFSNLPVQPIAVQGEKPSLYESAGHPIQSSDTINSSKWRDANQMNPELFIEQQEVPRLLPALINFARTFQVPQERYSTLTNCGIDTNFFTNLNMSDNPFAFANNLLAKFKTYQVSSNQLDYHPLIMFLDCVLSAGPENFGFTEQQAALSAVILARGQENLKALAVRSAVGRIESPERAGIGTGVLVGPDLLLTCRHVFNNVQQASVRFGYKKGSLGTEDVFDLNLNAVGTQNQLDYALVRIKGQPKPKPIRPVNRILSAGDEIQLRVIHHPEGQPVVISGVGQIVQVGEDYIDHTLQTAKGSSGAPIFDQNWDLIAIHRGDTRMGRIPSPNTTEGLPIYAIWEQISPHLT